MAKAYARVAQIPHSTNALICRMDSGGRVPFRDALTYLMGVDSSEHIPPKYRRWAARCGRAGNLHYVDLTPTSDIAGIELGANNNSVRLWIPPAYRMYADLDHEVVLVAAISGGVELWDHEKWKQFINQYPHRMKRKS